MCVDYIYDNTFYFTDNKEIANSFVPGRWFGVSHGEKSGMANEVTKYAWGTYKELLNTKEKKVYTFQIMKIELLDGNTTAENSATPILNAADIFSKSSSDSAINSL